MKNTKEGINDMCKEKMKFNIKKNSGLTLIALIVTIIVILILAGVTINLAINKNGIFQRAANAAQAYNTAEKAEDNALKDATAEMEKYAKQYGIDSLRDNTNSPIKDFEIKLVASKSEEIDIESNATSDESKIVAYVLLVNGEYNSTSTDGKFNVINLNYNTNYKVIVIAIDNLGNTKKSSAEYKTKQEILFDKEYLASGATYGNVSILEKNYNNKDGLSITGRSQTFTYNWATEFQTTMRWYKDIDLTGYNTLSFYARKGENHGSIYIEIGDASDGKQEFELGYHDFSSDWKKYEVDISNFSNGVHTLNIIGGYGDSSGYTSSNTQFSDIKLLTK